jgi:phosphoribosylformimino-5-aminoimidazole carboxamide ribotide isomerase
MIEGRGATFEILPAIDLLGGAVVRLRQGAFDRATAFSTDPVGVAHEFADAGARWLHIVDLDGARAGERTQRSIVRQIIGSLGGRAAIQVAGGLRTKAAVATAIDDGASRVVLGTAALTDPNMVRGLVAEHGSDRIAAAIDVRQGMAVGDGWRAGAAGRNADDLVGELAAAGVGCFIVTAIDRDGLLGGPDIGLLARIVATGAGRVIASGGISSIDDLEAVRDVGCAGAIVGRAIYEGRIQLREALAAL